ncbi:MAG: hypothetical protein AAFO03_12550 [Bacteroidota bacterium]
MKRSFVLLLAFACLLPISNLQAQDDRMTPEDLAILVGNWEGMLTYRNYRDGQLFDVRTNLEIAIGKDANQLLVKNTYPDEPNASGTYNLTIKKDGTRLNKAKVISRTVLEDGQVEVVTEYKGRDDNKKSLIRIIYRIGQDSYYTRKEVQFKGSTDWLMRNEFRYERV